MMIAESLRAVLRGHLLEAVENYIKKFPPNTKIYPDGLLWSSWDGDLALVTGPSSADRHPPSKEQFDPTHLARRYAIRPGLTMDGKPIKAHPKWTGEEPVIRGSSSLPYEKLTWSNGDRAYDPRNYIEGKFGSITAYWVIIPLKELSPGEIQVVTRQLDEDDFYDATDAKYQLKQAQWEKLLSMSAKDALNQDVDLSNAADEAITRTLGHYAKDSAEEEATWKKLGGAYKLSKKRDRIMWYFYR